MTTHETRILRVPGQLRSLLALEMVCCFRILVNLGFVNRVPLEGSSRQPSKFHFFSRIGMFHLLLET